MSLKRIANQVFSLHFSLHQLNCLYFTTQSPPHKFHNCYRHLKYKLYRCIVVPPFIKMCKTHLSLLSSDVRKSAAVVNGPTFSCPSMYGPPPTPNPFSLVCRLEQLCSHERSIRRLNDTALYLQALRTRVYHITSHHTRPEHIKPRHVTLTHHITTLFRRCCKMCTRGHKTSLCIHSREKTTHFYSQVKRHSRTT